jgi:L-fuculose-phosphate aldolase
MDRFDTRLMHPRMQISTIISRIYRRGLTTTSGGNISIQDEQGTIWVTPAGVDKGSLTGNDIIEVSREGPIRGLHQPSSEYPFHKAIYEIRPDLHAVIHAHPPALVGFSIVRACPDTNVIPQAKAVCGPIGYAPYELPGSSDLGESIAREFAKGFNAVIMENHGVVVAGKDLREAYERFETLEFCARTIIKAKTIGEPFFLSDADIEKFDDRYAPLLPEMQAVQHPSDERELRAQIRDIVHRACNQGLMISSYGTVSARWRGNDFLVTPRNISRWDMQTEDIVQINEGMREPGKLPSRSVRMHAEIYRRFPAVHSVIITQSPNVMAFSLTGKKFDDRTIPESWILLQDIPILPFSMHFGSDEAFVNSLGPKSPVLIVRNDSIIVTGKSILHAFDRLEVAEFSARSLIYSTPLGKMVPINEKQIEELRKKFLS